MEAAQGRLLVIETSHRVGVVALAEGSRLIGERRLDEARRHARDLVPAIRDLLGEAHRGGPVVDVERDVLALGHTRLGRHHARRALVDHGDLRLGVLVDGGDHEDATDDEE